MSSISQVIFYSLIGGVFSLIGGFILISNKNRAKSLATYATPFAAGALLSAAFLDLLMEASEAGNIEVALRFALAGILGFFLLERFLHWFHHHHEHDKKESDPTIPLIVVGDTMHNFIDGIAIAAGFLVDPSTGIVVTLAVAAHEIPQEIGDFGLLLHKGMSPKNVLKVNMLSAVATTLAAVIFFQLGQDVELPLDIVLGVVAGFFIYIAASDIIPTIHNTKNKGLANVQTGLLLAGVLVVGLATNILHEVIETDQHGDHAAAHEEDASHMDAAMHSHDMTFEVADHEILPEVAIELAKDAKSGWNLEVITDRFIFTPEDVNGDNVIGEGHAHIYVNDEKIARLYSPYFHIDSLNDGDVVRVTLNANDHSEYSHDGVVIQTETTVKD